MGISILKSGKAEAIQAAHEIMGDGTLDSCQRAVRNGCRNCCQNGALLFEGETLKVVPKGVSVFNGRVLDCLGENGCKFQSKDKPLLCKLSPVICAETTELGKRTATFYSGKICRVKLTSDFLERVSRVIPTLSGGGVWGWNGAPLTKATPEEIRAMFEFMKRFG